MKIIKRDFDKKYHDQLLYRETANSLRNKNRVKLLLEYKQAGRLLEIGCGKGGFLSLAEKYFSVEGIDISKYAIDSIKTHFGNRVQVADFVNWEIEPFGYDVIIAFNILEHLLEPRDAIQKIARGLREEGYLIGSVPFNANLVGQSITRIGNFLDRTHLSTFSPDLWLELFSMAGFKDVIFFGEITFGRNHNKYLFGKFWKIVAFNLMFVCRKDN